jgi:hypothetical protein
MPGMQTQHGIAVHHSAVGLDIPKQIVEHCMLSTGNAGLVCQLSCYIL